jgi:glucan-binding YG repeat protein
MKTPKTTRWLAIVLAVVMLIGVLPMSALAAGSVKEYSAFLSALKVLEDYADTYADISGKDAGELVINFIRTGVERYNDGNWKTLAGEEIVGFTSFVEEQDAANGTNAMDLRDIVIDDFRLPNGNLTDFGHMFGTMNIAYVAAVATGDLGGWAGDLCDLLLYSKEYGNVPAGTIQQMADYIRTKCFGVDADDAFGMDDFYGDMDAFYLITKFKGGSQKLSELMEDYFTVSLSDADRAAFFLNNRFKGLKTQADVRAAILGTYTANTGLAVLEADRGLSECNDLRTACCYGFADYLYGLAKDRLTGDMEEEEETPYYSVFSSTESILAPGISQTINFATTADGKQIVYYVATVDVNREDVTIMANYKDNNPGDGWGMQRVEDQANALINNYKDKYENFNVIVATNGDGYNMSTGKPGGLLVMNGVEWHPVDGDGFFAILKDGTAMIGTQAEYAQYKDQIQDAIGAFGATLVKNGKMAVNKSSTYYSSRASRTAIGITAEGKVVMMVLDGRQEPFSAGGSMEEIAQIMLDAGCVQAVNLDGGGSTTYLSKPEGSDKLQLVSRPSDGYARSVATSLVAISTAKSSKEFDHANITSDYDYLTIGTQLQLTATGVSNTGNAAPIPSGAIWRVSDYSIATVTQDGLFTARDNGEVAVEILVGGKVVGSKTLNVVVPDAISMPKGNQNVVLGVPTAIGVEVSYQGNLVAFNEMDVFMTSDDEFTTFEGLLMTVPEDCTMRSMGVYAILNETGDYAEIVAYLYAPGEAYFDFDKATVGNRTLAWLREVNNTNTEDDLLYEIVEPGKDMDIDYTFALDMTSFEIPEQLQDITYMLPGADQGSTAWDFLLYLAERVSVLSTVKVTAQFSPDVEVDLSNLKVSCDLFFVDDVELTENNQLTITCKWIDRTQAIDKASVSGTCILSGIKMRVKDGASWDKNNQLLIRNTGKVTYRIYLRASSLYSFACSPNNQAKYGLLPFVNPDVIISGKEEAGAYFESEYVDFEDTFILDKTDRNGWSEKGGVWYYFQDNEPVTGVQYLPSREDESVMKYYHFAEDGACSGVYTGLIEEGGKLKYALAGILQKGWQSVMDSNGESFYYYFDPYTYAAVGEGEGWITVENYQYYFVNYKCMKGKVVKTSKGYQYRFAGTWQRNQWVEQDGAWYYIERQYVAITGGFAWTRTIDGSGSACYLFGEDGKLRTDLTGLYHVGNDTYLLEEGRRIEEAGLVFIDGYYYYFAANAKAVKGRSYWPSKTNNLLPAGNYTFDAQGRLVNPPVTPEPDVPDVPDTPDTPDTPDVPEKPKLNGVVKVNGALYYYKNDVIQYAAGLIKLENGKYIYVRSNGQLAIGNYWVTNNNDLLPVAMYTFNSEGMMVQEGEEPETPDTPDTPDTPVVPEIKNGVVEVNGILYYYENNTIKYCAGLVKLDDGSYIYVRSNGMLAIGDYWITNNNGLLPQQTYTFGADGKMVTQTQEPEQPDTPDTPDTPVDPKPEPPAVKDGIVVENGKQYYYNNGTIAYAAGLIKLTDENGVDFYIYVRSNGQLATGVYWPTNHNDLLPYKGYDFGTDGRLYL